jgi:hypothetical protein
LEKTLHKKGLVEWLKVKALNSNPSITKNIYIYISWAPVILATWEAEIRWIKVQSQPKQIVCETLSQNKTTKKGCQSGLRCRP